MSNKEHLGNTFMGFCFGVAAIIAALGLGLWILTGG